MKHLKDFKLFESNISFLSKESIDKIDREIAYNCDDILRDFNEDNNCEFSFIITYRANANAIVHRINPTSPIGYSFAEKVMSLLGDKKDIIEIFIRHTGYINSPHKTLIETQRENCMKHIISYFESLGYKYLLNGSAIYYFYKN